jgi:hypothetical protein
MQYIFKNSKRINELTHLYDFDAENIFHNINKHMKKSLDVCACVIIFLLYFAANFSKCTLTYFVRHY